MPHDYDLFVIGGGSGGVRCARIAAGHGARVGIAEELHWGGTCVNVGCVPKKLMVQAAEYGAWADDAHGFGWSTRRGTHDWQAFIASKDHEIARLNSAYLRILDTAGVVSHKARASFVDAHTLQVGEERVTAANIVVATGGLPVRSEIEGAALGIVSDDAFSLEQRPDRITLIGSGYIGVEFAGIFAGLGAEVDLLYRQDLPLAGFDHEIRQHLASALQRSGIRLHTSIKLHKVEQAGACKRLTLTDGRQFDSDLVFFALGRVPHTKPLRLEAAGIAADERGGIVVDAENRSSVPHIYAIGDVSNRLNLTPVALAEGHHLADRLFGTQAPRSWSFAAVPTAVFSSPPIGTVGLTEQEAARHGLVDVYTAEFTALRHKLTGRDRPSFLKLVVDQASQRVLGAHMIGEDAPEMMQGLAIAITAGATKQDFDRTIGIHPTIAEEWVTLRQRTRVSGEARRAAE